MKNALKAFYIALVPHGLTGAFFIPWDKFTWPAFWHWIVIWPHQAGDKARYLLIQWLVYSITIAIGVQWFTRIKTDRLRIVLVVAVLCLLSIVGATVSPLTS